MPNTRQSTAAIGTLLVSVRNPNNRAEKASIQEFIHEEIARGLLHFDLFIFKLLVKPRFFVAKGHHAPKH